MQLAFCSASPSNKGRGQYTPRGKELSYERSAVHTYADLEGDEICLGWVNLNAVVAALAHASQLMLWTWPVAWESGTSEQFRSRVHFWALLVFDEIGMEMISF
jgi:hypothetical protein